MSKVLKRLYLGDVVKSFGTKQLRKLTTDEPMADMIGTWVLKQSLTYDDNVPNSSQLPSGDVECEVFVDGVLTKTYVKSLGSTNMVGGRTIYLGHYSDNTNGGSWNYGYYQEKKTGYYNNTLVGGYVVAHYYSGTTSEYFLWSSEIGVKLRTLKVVKVSDSSNTFWTWLKANASKIA